jgi:uncharacterized protein
VVIYKFSIPKYRWTLGPFAPGSRIMHRIIYLLLLVIPTGIFSQTMYDLVTAAKTNNLVKMQQIIATGMDVNSYVWETTALIGASEKGNVEAVKLLIDAGAKTELTSGKGQTALFIAVANSTEVVRILIKAGANVNAKNEKSHTALMRAIEFGSMETIKLLLASNADVNAQDYYGFTALTWLVQQERDDANEIVALLINSGADVNLPSVGGETALITAACHGKAKIVKSLLDAKARVNMKGQYTGTALRCAKGNKRREVVKLLKGAGVRK